MYITKQIFLSCFLSVLSSAVFALGTVANNNVIKYDSIPGSSFILNSGQAYVPPGTANQRLGTTDKQCPSTFTPSIVTSISEANSQNNACPITAIHATNTSVQKNGNGYDVYIQNVSVDSTPNGTCFIHGLTLNWAVYCMPNKTV